MSHAARYLILNPNGKPIERNIMISKFSIFFVIVDLKFKPQHKSKILSLVTFADLQIGKTPRKCIILACMCNGEFCNCNFRTFVPSHSAQVQTDGFHPSKG